MSQTLNMFRCEIEEDFVVETRICRLCVILRSRAFYVRVYVLVKGTGRRFPLKIACTRNGQQGDVNQLWTETIKNPFLTGSQCDGCGMYQYIIVYMPSSRTAGDGGERR